MLSNAYFLAKFRFDTAENEPAKNLQNFFKICQFSRPRARGELRRRNAAFKAEESTAELPRRALGARGPATLRIGNFANFANFWRARSRLYQNEFLQENMRLTAFFKLYKICILLHRCNRKNLAKNRFEKSAIFVKISKSFANVAEFAKFCQFSKISAG